MTQEQITYLLMAIAAQLLAVGIGYVIWVRSGRWQPIETAPDEGLIIIAGDGSVGFRWTADREELTFDCLNPTHWTPIPSPPKGNE